MFYRASVINESNTHFFFLFTFFLLKRKKTAPILKCITVRLLIVLTLATEEKKCFFSILWPINIALIAVSFRSLDLFIGEGRIILSLPLKMCKNTEQKCTTIVTTNPKGFCRVGCSLVHNLKSKHDFSHKKIKMWQSVVKFYHLLLI